MNRTTQIESLVRPEGVLQLSLVERDLPPPGPDEVLVRVDATPINPSDLALLTAFAHPGKATVDHSGTHPVLTAPIAPAAMALLQARIGQPMAVGNEGAGEVIAAGASEGAQALMGKTVGMFGGDMYGQYRCLHYRQCIPMREEISAGQAASCFVNPMTVLAMLETLKQADQTAVIHTAAASNLGQMLNRLCIDDGVDLINIVRRPEQEELLRSQGARHVLNSTSPDFMTELTEAIVETGAMVAFDAIGGGDLGSRILTAMEAAAARSMTAYDRYGSDQHKQLYVYGALDPSAIQIKRTIGFAWSVSGWLLPNILRTLPGETLIALQGRIADEIDTTFASSYTQEISLAGVLDPDNMAAYSRQATGEKFLIRPHAD